jgi:uncharacterized protein (TIGR02118 family)
MFKMFAFYTEPQEADKAKFDEHYLTTHIPLCHKLPGIVRVEVSKFNGALGGGSAPYYQVAELVFNTKADFDAAMATPEGKAVGRDTRNFPSGLLTMAFAETVE